MIPHIDHTFDKSEVTTAFSRITDLYRSTKGGLIDWEIDALASRIQLFAAETRYSWVARNRVIDTISPFRTIDWIGHVRQRAEVLIEREDMQRVASDLSKNGCWDGDTSIFDDAVGVRLSAMKLLRPVITVNRFVDEYGTWSVHPFSYLYVPASVHEVGALSVRVHKAIKAYVHNEDKAS